MINYDIPYDVEAYIHRIGRTGRAGRNGEAILFAANRERRLLRAIEKATGKNIEKMELPTADEVSDKRTARFRASISETLASQDLSLYRKIIEEHQAEEGVPVIEIAAALAHLAQGDKPLVSKASKEKKPPRENKPARTEESREGKTAPRRERKPADDVPDAGLERFRIEVGRKHGVAPGNIVGAISNEAELDSEYIGRIVIHDDYSTVDLPEGMPKDLFRHLKGVWVSGQKMQISRLEAVPPRRKASRPKKKPSAGKNSKVKGRAVRRVDKK